MPNVSTLGASQGMSKKLILLFSISSGIAVGNLYWSQPLLSYIGHHFNIPASHAGLLVTLTQLGYAFGVLLILPLGDKFNRRRLIPFIMLLSGFMLATSALATSFYFLLISLFFVGLTTITGQLLVPLAGDMSPEGERGKVVGTIVSGILIGILTSRSISGLLADIWGWRAIYIFASFFTILLSLILMNMLPNEKMRTPSNYFQLLRSIFTVVHQHPSVKLTLFLSAITFSVFTLFWTGLTFLLSSAAFNYTASQIGVIGIFGIAGAIAARRAGRLADAGWSAQATGMAFVFVLLSLIIAKMGETSIVLIIIAVIVLDIAIQVLNVLNQTRLFDVDNRARSRLNTAFVFSNFCGGALGSWLAGILWQYNGWMAISIGEIALIILALLFWAMKYHVLKNNQPLL